MTSAATSSAAGTIRNAIKAHPAVKSCSAPSPCGEDDLCRGFTAAFHDGSKFFLAITEVQEHEA